MGDGVKRMMPYTAALVGLGLMCSSVLLGTPASASNQTFSCDAGVALRFLDEGNVAVVRFGTDPEVFLPNVAFTGDALIYALDPKASSCRWQRPCVSGIWHDMASAFDVYIGKSVYNCTGPGGGE